MIVKCINGDFSDSDSEVIKAILLVGDDGCLPKEGELYEVIGFHFFPKGVEAYELAEVEDSSHYGKKLVFCKERFETVDESLPNNFYDETIGPCRIYNFSWNSLEIPLKTENNEQRFPGRQNEI